MPNRGVCALVSKPETPHLFLVAKLRFGAGGRVDFVLLTEVDPKTNLLVSAEEVPVSEVVELIHSGHQVRPMFPTQQDRAFELKFAVVGHFDGSESIALDGESTSGLGLRDIMGMDAAQAGASFAAAPSEHAYRARDAKSEARPL